MSLPNFSFDKRMYCPPRERLQTTSFIQEAHQSIYDVKRINDDDFSLPNNETDWETGGWAVHNV